MKVYISVDIEGITGVTSWYETTLGEAEHKWAREQMTKEALAACEAAIEMGAREVYIKDAHDSARNIDITKFPKEAKIIRGWAGEPTSMIEGLDSSFDALIFIGYHSASGRNGNPLAHTISHSKIMTLKVDGELASEFSLNTCVAGERQVPVVFVSGDKMLSKEVKDFNKDIVSLAVKEGVGGSTISISPDLACELIKEGVKEGIRNKDKIGIKNKKGPIKAEITYRDHTMANKARYYPGVKRIGDYTVEYSASTMEELMTTRMFIM